MRITRGRILCASADGFRDAKSVTTLRPGTAMMPVRTMRIEPFRNPSLVQRQVTRESRELCPRWNGRARSGHCGRRACIRVIAGTFDHASDEGPSDVCCATPVWRSAVDRRSTLRMRHDQG